MTTIITMSSLTNNHQGARERMFDIYDFDFNNRTMNGTFIVNDVKEIDEKRHKISFDIEMTASWQDSRISCLFCGAAADEEKEVT